MNSQVIMQMLAKFGWTSDLMGFVIAGGLMLTRIIIALSIVPFAGGRQVPGRIRIALAMTLVLFAYPLVSSTFPYPFPESYYFILALFFKETVFGFLLGLMISMVFQGIQGAGAMVDNQRQLANAQIFNPSIGAQATIFGVFYYQFAIIIFILMGGHIFFFKGLIESFYIVPLYEFPKWVYPNPMAVDISSLPIITSLLEVSTATFMIALQISAPVLIAIFVSDLILGLTNRFAPMVNVFELGFSIKGWAGVLLVWMSVPVVYEQMKKLFVVAMEVYQKSMHYFMMP